MRKLILFLTVVGVLVSAEAVFADAIIEDTAETLYQRASASATNFADPNGYNKQGGVQSPGSDSSDGGTGSDAGTAGGGAGSSDGGNTR